MVKLKVINLQRESRKKFKKIFVIIILILLIINIFKMFFENYDYEINFNVNLKNNNDTVLSEKYKKILGNSFVFLGTENIEKGYIEEKGSNINKIQILKNSISLLGFVNINSSQTDSDNNIQQEDVLDNVNVAYENTNEVVSKTKEDIINNYTLSKEDEEFLNSNFVYTKTYEISAKNTKDVFDVALEEIPKKLDTKVVLEKNKEDKYNTVIGNVKIRNESKYEINENLLNFDFKLNDKNDIVIYHTHTCESYTASEKYNYVQTGNYRSTDLSYSVCRVGEVLEHYLIRMNYNVTHSIAYHDYPAYNGSYNRALTTVKNLLNTNSSDIVIDLHRDAIGNNSDYGPTLEINGERVAQLMFVIGTDGGGLTHNNWKENLKFAVELQEKAEEMYPGLFKPIIVRNARYNQHVGKAAVIIEVGATGNTLEEAEGAMKYLSIVLDEYIKEN